MTQFKLMNMTTNDGKNVDFSLIRTSLCSKFILNINKILKLVNRLI